MADFGRAVDVRVRLPKGEITEWYPQATRIGSSYQPNGLSPPLEDSLIEWKGVTVLSRDTTEVSADKLIRTCEAPIADHYYSARTTDANLLSVSSVNARARVEYERDLFCAIRSATSILWGGRKAVSRPGWTRGPCTSVSTSFHTRCATMTSSCAPAWRSPVPRT